MVVQQQLLATNCTSHWQLNYYLLHHFLFKGKHGGQHELSENARSLPIVTLTLGWFEPLIQTEYADNSWIQRLHFQKRAASTFHSYGRFILSNLQILPIIFKISIFFFCIGCNRNKANKQIPRLWPLLLMVKEICITGSGTNGNGFRDPLRCVNACYNMC